jgi:hypothetical protein
MADPTQAEALIIELESGLRLEADLWVPRNVPKIQGNKLAVCLHPWSWIGGRKDDPYAQSFLC